MPLFYVFINLYILDLDGYFFFPIGALVALYNVDIGRKIKLTWTMMFFVIPWLSFNVGKVVIATYEDKFGEKVRICSADHFWEQGGMQVLSQRQMKNLDNGNRLNHPRPPIKKKNRKPRENQ